MDHNDPPVKTKAQAQADIATKRANLYATLRKRALLEKVADDINLKAWPKDKDHQKNGDDLPEDELEDELSRLRKTHKNIRNSYKSHEKIVARCLDELSAEYATECRALCTEMQEKLPREIRDMIYPSVLELPPPTNSSRDRLSYWADKDARFFFNINNEMSPESVRSFDPLPVLQICTTDILGPLTLRELAEVYYRTLTFGFEVVYHTKYQVQDDINAFTQDSIWGLSLNVCKLVKNLEVRITTLGLYNPYFPANGISLSSYIKSLLKFKGPLNIKFSFKKHSSNQSPAIQAREELRWNFEYYCQLLEAGHNVSIRIYPGEEVKLPRENLSIDHWMTLLDWGTHDYPTPIRNAMRSNNG